MSLFIIGSVSRITSNIVLQLAKNNQYKSITIADILPTYDFHHRFYRLQKDLDQSQLTIDLNLTKLTNINDLSKQSNFDDVLYVTHDYYSAVTSKTKLMELTAQANKNRNTLFFTTPIEYDHFSYAEPAKNYLDAENRVLEINPNSTFIRSNLQDSNEAAAYFRKSNNGKFGFPLVSSAKFAQVVAETLKGRVQGSKILVPAGSETPVSNTQIPESEYTHAKQNLDNFFSKWYKFSESTESQTSKQL